MSTEPALLPGGQVVLAGKSRIAYLLNGAHLGGIGGQLASLGPVCGGDIDGGGRRDGQHRVPALPRPGSWRSARRRHRLACGCCGGPGPAAARPSWPAAWSGRSARTGTLYGLDPPTGQVRQQGVDRRRRGEPLPDPERGRRPAAGPGRQPGRGVPARPVQEGGTAPAARPGQPRPVGSTSRRGPCRAATHPPGPVRGRYRGHRGRQPAGADRDRLAGVAPRAEPAVGGRPPDAKPGPGSLDPGLVRSQKGGVSVEIDRDHGWRP